VLMTSLGNTIINALVIIYAASVSGVHPMNMLKFKFEGDDSVTFVNSVDPGLSNTILRSLASLGFQVKQSTKWLNPLGEQISN
jgi:hypothetical protein